MKFYKIRCKVCKKITLHSIAHMSKRKGIKLLCDRCLSVQPRYHNKLKLQEFKE